MCNQQYYTYFDNFLTYLHTSAPAAGGAASSSHLTLTRSCQIRTYQRRCTRRLQGEIEFSVTGSCQGSGGWKRSQDLPQNLLQTNCFQFCQLFCGSLQSYQRNNVKLHTVKSSILTQSQQCEMKEKQEIVNNRFVFHEIMQRLFFCVPTQAVL